jgi:hypothetical protein
MIRKYVAMPFSVKKQPDPFYLSDLSVVLFEE